MSTHSHRLALLTLGILILPGCLLPYCVPALSHVPSCDVDCEGAQVHAFRLDVIKRDVPEGRNTERLLLTPVTLTDTGKTPSLEKVSCSYGIYTASPVSATGSMMDTRSLMALRLYRFGYETAEVGAGSTAGKIVWKPARDAAAQEKALNDLFGFDNPAASTPGAPVVERQLESGRGHAAHREALLFGAGEYRRLAEKINPTTPDLKLAQTRLLTRAGQLLALAGKHP